MVMYFSEKDIKPMIVNATNAKTIQKLFKSPYIEDWAGRKIEIYVEKVKAFGELVEALRIKPTIPVVNVPQSDKPIKCTDCDADIHGVGDRTAQQIAQYTSEKYGKALCGGCATKAKEAIEIKDVLN